MTGDQANCLARIKTILPPWFGQGPTPVLDGMLSGPAWVLAWVYTLYAYAAPQVRLATATDGFLELFASDFFGSRMKRAGDDDTTYRLRIQASLFRPRNSLWAVSAAVLAVTGNVPAITEGAYTATVTVNPGSATSGQIAEAIDAVRPICCAITLVLSGTGSELLTDESGNPLTDSGGNILTT